MQRYRTAERGEGSLIQWEKVVVVVVVTNPHCCYLSIDATQHDVLYTDIQTQSSVASHQKHWIAEFDMP